jgi:hypothetical protein
MNPHQLKRLFPNASQSTIAANSKDYGTGAPDDPSSTKIPHSKPTEPKKPLGAEHEGKTSSAGRPLVRFTLSRVRLLDADAKWGSVKDVLDGLQYAGLIRGDREDQIDLEVRQQKVSSYKKESTEVEIVYP